MRDRNVPAVATLRGGFTSPKTFRRWIVEARIDRGLVTGSTIALWRSAVLNAACNVTGCALGPVGSK